SAAGAPRRAPDPPAPGRDGEVGRLSHRLLAPRARVRRPRSRPRRGRGRAVDRRRPARREALGRPASRVPQPAPRGRHLHPDRNGYDSPRPRPDLIGTQPMSPLERVVHRAQNAVVLVQAGLIGSLRPDKVAKTLLLLHRWGPTPAAGYQAAAVRYP